MNKTFIILSCLIFALAAGFLGAKFLLAPALSASQQGTAPSVENPVENSTPNPSQFAKNTPPGSASPETDNKTPIKFDGENPNNLDSLTGYFSVKRLEGDRLTLRVNLDQYLSSGTCSLKVLDASGTLLVENSVEILPDASTSTCAGFDLTSSNLLPSATVSSLSEAKTPLSLILTLSSSSKSGTIETSVE